MKKTQTNRMIYWLLILLAALSLIGLACRALSPTARTPAPTLAVKMVEPSTEVPATQTPKASQPETTPDPSDPTAAATVDNLAVAGTETPVPTQMPTDLQMRVFENLWQTVNDIYLYPDFNGLDWNAVHTEYQQKIEAGMSNQDFYTAMREIIDSLGDNHSYFLSPDEAKAQAEELSGSYNYVGIGVYLSPSPDNTRAVILSVFPNSPAEKAGLKPRDSILTANGEPIIDENGFLKTIIRGPEGTQVTVEVQTPGEEPRTLTITRSAINSNISLPHNVITSPAGKRIGYITLFTFNNSTIPDIFKQTLEEMSSEGSLNGLIIDVRGNEGGSIKAMTDVLSYFTSGVLGHFKSREQDNALDVGAGEDLSGSQTYPVVILIGKGSYSAGEIFPGIMQDMGRAYLIGETTNGVVETKYVYDFEDGSEAEIAAEAFHPINHPDTTWQNVGVIPDLEMPNQWDKFTVAQEPAVIAGLNYIDTQK